MAAINSHTTADALFKQLESRLELRWISGRDLGKRRINYDPASVDHPVIGHLSPARRYTITLVGSQEQQYIHDLGAIPHPDDESGDSPPLYICCATDTIPTALADYCESIDAVLLHSPCRSQTVWRETLYALDHQLASPLILHGVFMDVMGVGVLIRGQASIGKSEVALELLSRGHRLVADDAPEFRRTEPDTITGTCPPMLSNFIEVRGLGILNARALFGDSALKTRQNLRVIVELVELSEVEFNEFDRLRGSRQMVEILGVPITQITLPVAPGRNLAVLLETAVRNQILLNRGYDSCAEFTRRQSALMAESES
ncbi:MAG: HPr(Ser) kinase/phosphatase [Gammaproteobacteria bacterium]